MTRMSCCETNNSNRQDCETNENDSCSSPPKKQPHIDLISLYNIDVAAFKESYGPDFDVLEFVIKQGENLMDPELWYPPPPVSRVTVVENICKRPNDLECAELALQFLKATKGEEYEFVEIRSMHQIWSREFTHLNFYARPKDSETVRLFYADVDHSGDSREVMMCSIVDPGFCGLCDNIVHPDGVNCIHCNFYDVCPSSDEE